MNTDNNELETIDWNKEVVYSRNTHIPDNSGNGIVIIGDVDCSNGLKCKLIQVKHHNSEDIQPGYVLVERSTGRHVIDPNKMLFGENAGVKNVKEDDWRVVYVVAYSHEITTSLPCHDTLESAIAIGKESYERGVNVIGFLNKTNGVFVTTEEALELY